MRFSLLVELSQRGIPGSFIVDCSELFVEVNILLQLSFKLYRHLSIN